MKRSVNVKSVIYQIAVRRLWVLVCAGMMSDSSPVTAPARPGSESLYGYSRTTSIAKHLRNKWLSFIHADFYCIQRSYTVGFSWRLMKLTLRLADSFQEIQILPFAFAINYTCLTTSMLSAPQSVRNILYKIPLPSFAESKQPDWLFLHLKLNKHPLKPGR